MQFISSNKEYIDTLHMDFSMANWMLLLKNTSSDFHDTKSQSDMCFVQVINRHMTMAHLWMWHLLNVECHMLRKSKKTLKNGRAQSTCQYLENFHYPPWYTYGSLTNITQWTTASIPYPANSMSWIWTHGKMVAILLLVPCASPLPSLQFIQW